MSILNGLFGKKRRTEANVIYAPCKGNVIALERFPDEVFSTGVMGKGCGIWPEEGCISAPFDGEIIQIAETKHAICLRSRDGIEVIIHIGLDTVEMNGNGFKVLVQMGETVSMGKKLVLFDMDKIKKAGYQNIAAIIVLNSAVYQAFDLLAEGQTDMGKAIIKLLK